jgi:hypothetical protein
MITGKLTLNGLMDDDIIKLLEMKKRHANLAFDPTNLRRAFHQAPPNHQPKLTEPPAYDGASFSRTDEESLNLVKEIFHVVTGSRQ